MWIKMNSTYAGSIGLFAKDCKYDLPADIIKHLPKGSFKKTVAPWDEQKDKSNKKAKSDGPKKQKKKKTKQKKKSKAD